MHPHIHLAPAAGVVPCRVGERDSATCHSPNPRPTTLAFVVATCLSASPPQHPASMHPDTLLTLTQPTCPSPFPPSWKVSPEHPSQAAPAASPTLRSAGPRQVVVRPPPQGLPHPGHVTVRVSSAWKGFLVFFIKQHTRGKDRQASQRLHSCQQPKQWPPPRTSTQVHYATAMAQGCTMWKCSDPFPLPEAPCS
jgi:hypothetical protein